MHHFPFDTKFPPLCSYSITPLLIIVLLFFAGNGYAATSDTSTLNLSLPHVNVDKPQDVATAIKILILLTVLSLAPALLVVMTSFTRIVIVLSMLRHALGMQETPPNTVLISLALFLSLFQMMPIFDSINTTAFQPYMDGQLSLESATTIGSKPLKEFMIRQTRENDILLILDLAKVKMPESVEQISLTHLIPAFMLSELKTAFQIGFVIFLPFLLIDLLTSSVLMSMGMLMVPPMMISLPLKILMFVLIDGWNLIVHSLMSSFH